MEQSQRSLSEQLQLLHELQYSDLNTPYLGSGTHSNKHSRDPAIIVTCAFSHSRGSP
jgi:hypothetical protein